MKSSKKKLTEAKRAIETYMQERDHPAWFRGLSVFQTEAADSLLNCIRDDSQQETSHRVRDAMRRLGIEPPVGPSKIKLVMHLSRGNDIAFLWFLMELYYRKHDGSGDPRTYSVNEQIFFTVIAYLDTVPTLRELDKLLPQKMPDVKKTKTQPVKRKPKSKSSTRLVCPYFQKQPRPILYGKDLTLKETPRYAKFTEYPHAFQEDRCVLNENSRWFGDYELNNGKRFAKDFIEEQMASVFEEHVEKSISCQHHQSLVALKKSMENTRKVAKKKDCEKYFDVEGYFQNQSYKRVMDQLNREIENIKNSKLDTNRESRFSNLNQPSNNGSVNKVPSRFSNLNQPSNNGSVNKVPSKVKKTRIDDSNRPPDNKKNCNQQSRVNNGSVNKVPPEVAKTSFDFGYPVLGVKSHLFKARTLHLPYKFNYDKIFDMGCKDPVKEAITSALNEGNSDNEIDRKKAVKNICDKMWSEQVKMHNLKYEREKKEQKLLESKPAITQPNVIELDPHNDKLIFELLKKGLDELKKDKKFVLATLPDAHKWPVLKEWARKRFGLSYTREEKLKEFLRTKQVFYYLRKNALNVQVPKIDELSQKPMVSYGCRDYLVKKGNHLREVYEFNFKERLLEDARAYWSAFRPYQCSQGPPRNEFFAYLPARKNDIHLFRPWKKFEYNPANVEWLRRRRKMSATS